MTILKTAWPWLVFGAGLIALGLFVVGGGAATIVLACGFVVLFGAGIRLISRNDSRPAEERRVPAGHSGA